MVFTQTKKKSFLIPWQNMRYHTIVLLNRLTPDYNILQIEAEFKKKTKPKSTVNFASGGQNPFYKKGSGLPKIFH